MYALSFQRKHPRRDLIRLGMSAVRMSLAYIFDLKWSCALFEFKQNYMRSEGRSTLYRPFRSHCLAGQPNERIQPRMCSKYDEQYEDTDEDAADNPLPEEHRGDSNCRRRRSACSNHGGCLRCWTILYEMRRKRRSPRVCDLQSSSKLQRCPSKCCHRLPPHATWI
jgi:hypothetical protein